MYDDSPCAKERNSTEIIKQLKMLKVVSCTLQFANVLVSNPHCIARKKSGDSFCSCLQFQLKCSNHSVATTSHTTDT